MDDPEKADAELANILAETITASETDLPIGKKIEIYRLVDGNIGLAEAAYMHGNLTGAEARLDKIGAVTAAFGIANPRAYFLRGMIARFFNEMSDAEGNFKNGIQADLYGFDTQRYMGILYREVFQNDYSIYEAPDKNGPVLKPASRILDDARRAFSQSQGHDGDQPDFVKIPHGRNRQGGRGAPESVASLGN